MNLTFIQTPMFVVQAARLKLTDEDVQALEQLIMEFPERGNVMRQTGGIRKIRFAPSWHTGKSGATRVCYVVFNAIDACYFVSVFAKNEKANLSDKESDVARVG